MPSYLLLKLRSDESDGAAGTVSIGKRRGSITPSSGQARAALSHFAQDVEYHSCTALRCFLLSASKSAKLAAYMAGLMEMVLGVAMPSLKITDKTEQQPGIRIG
jgi:hypothetical protein